MSKTTAKAQKPNKIYAGKTFEPDVEQQPRFYQGIAHVNIMHRIPQPLKCHQERKLRTGKEKHRKAAVTALPPTSLLFAATLLTISLQFAKKKWN